MSRSLSDAEILRRAVELGEAEAWAQLHLTLPESYRDRMGIAVHRHGGAVALVTAGSAELAVNRVIGLGVLTPLTPQLTEAIIGHYSIAGVNRFLIQANPGAITDDMHHRLLARGFVASPGVAKLCRATDALRRLPLGAGLRVVEIDRSGAEEFARIVGPPLMVPEEMRPGIWSAIGHPGWRYYLALDGARAIAGAASYAGQDVAWCGLAATLESDRGRGAQTALLVRRVRDAAENGCRWVTAETMLERPDRPNPSVRNMRRLGFDVLHQRTNYLFDFGSTPPPLSG